MNKEERARQAARMIAEGTVFLPDGSEVWYKSFLLEMDPLEVIASESDYEAETIVYRVRQTSRMVVSNE